MLNLKFLGKVRFAMKDLIIFSIPIVLGQLGQMLIGFGDTLVAAQYSTDTVAAVGLSLGFINAPFFFGIGVLNSVSPKLSIKRGAGESTDKFYTDILWLSLIVFIVSLIATYNVKLIIPHVGFDETLLPLMDTYIDIIVWSFFPAYLFQGAKEYLQAKENVFVPNLLSIIFVFVNVGLNYLMVFGMWGIPEMGIAGTAWASVIVRVLMALSLLMYIQKLPSLKIDYRYLWEQIQFGVPVGIMFLFEVCAFSLVSILAGKFGIVESASNTIVLTLGGLSFMIPLSLGFAASVKVGNFFGQKNYEKAKEYIYSAIIITSVIMLSVSIIYISFPGPLIRIFTSDPEVIALSISLFFIVAIFQLFDGIQAVLAGALRGLGITKELTYVATLSYWILGLPFGVWLAFYKDFKAYGLWIGLAISLGLMAVSFLILLSYKLKRMK